MRALAKSGKASQFSTTERETRATWTRAAHATCRRNCERLEADVSGGERALVEPLIPLPPKTGRSRPRRSPPSFRLHPVHAGSRVPAETTVSGGSAGCDAGGKIRGPGGRYRDAGEGVEAVGGRRLPGPKACVEAPGAWPRRYPGDCGKALGYRGLLGPLPPPGSWTSICLDVAPAAAVERLRKQPGEFSGLAPAGRLPLSRAARGPGDNSLKSSKKMQKVNYGSNS